MRTILLTCALVIALFSAPAAEQGTVYRSGQIFTAGGAVPAPPCSNGDLYILTTAAPGIYVCSANAWVQVGAWGGITGTLSAQSDLQTALNGKQASGTYATGTGTASGTNTGDQTTVSGNAGTATTLLNARTINGTSFNGSANITLGTASVTLAQMADMATASILGRNTAATGVPEVLSAATTKTLLSLNNVENTALSTWAGSTALTTLAAAINLTTTGNLGWNTGAGGAQTQATSKATTVVSNTTTTAITMNAASLAAATIVSFTFTNSKIAATDQVVCTHQSAGTSAAYTINAFPGAGSAVVSVRNNTAGALAEAIVLRCSVYKAVSS